MVEIHSWKGSASNMVKKIWSGGEREKGQDKIYIWPTDWPSAHWPSSPFIPVGRQDRSSDQPDVHCFPPSEGNLQVPNSGVEH